MTSFVPRSLVVLTIALTLISCGADVERVGLYDRTGVPAVPDRSAPIPSDLGDTVTPGGLDDGDYWASGVAVSGGDLVFHLVEALAGPTCADVLGSERCATGIGVVEPADGGLRIELVVGADDARRITAVSVVDDNRRNYAITPDELAALAAGRPPAAEAPDGYVWTDDPFLVVVRGGRVEAVRQVWVD